MITDIIPAFISSARGPQLVELFNDMCATATDLGIEQLGGKPLVEVTRFSTIENARRRCYALHLEVARARTLQADTIEVATSVVSEPVVVAADTSVLSYREPEPAALVEDAPVSVSVASVTTALPDTGIEAILEQPPVIATEHPQPGRAIPPAKAARSFPKYTMESVVVAAGGNPYEPGTEAHAVFEGLEPGMTVRAFCAAHGKYPRGLNLLNPMLKAGAVETRTPVHGVLR